MCENIPVTQGCKYTETILECKFRDKFRALKPAMKLQGYLRDPAPDPKIDENNTPAALSKHNPAFLNAGIVAFLA